MCRADVHQETPPVVWCIANEPLDFVLRPFLLLFFYLFPYSCCPSGSPPLFFFFLCHLLFRFDFFFVFKRRRISWCVSSFYISSSLVINVHREGPNRKTGARAITLFSIYLVSFFFALLLSSHFLSQGCEPLNVVARRVPKRRKICWAFRFV